LDILRHQNSAILISVLFIYRMTLDDNHNSVVLACAKVIQCILSCDVNENFFEISEVEDFLFLFFFFFFFFYYYYYFLFYQYYSEFNLIYYAFRKLQPTRRKSLLPLCSEVNQRLMLVSYMVDSGSTVLNLLIFFLLTRMCWMLSLKGNIQFRTILWLVDRI